MRPFPKFKSFIKTAKHRVVVFLRRLIAFPGEKVPNRILKILKSESAPATMQSMGWWKEKDPSLASPLDPHYAFVMPEKRFAGKVFTQEVWSIQKIKIRNKVMELILRETCYFKENENEVLIVERRVFDPENGLYFWDLPTLEYDFKENRYKVKPRKSK